MSFFVIPAQDTFSHRPAPFISGGCGSSARSVASPRLDPLSDTNAIPRSLLGALFGVDDNAGDDDDQNFLSWNPWQLEQIRRQKSFREAQRRQSILQAKRQQQHLLEQERLRRREQALRERERAIRLAILHREQQRRAYEEYQQQQQRAAAAREYQRRVEAYQRRQQLEYAKRHERDWEQALFGVINLAQQMFGGEVGHEAAATSATPLSEKEPKEAETKQDEEVQVRQAEPIQSTEAAKVASEATGTTEAKAAEESPVVATEQAATPAPTSPAQEANTSRLLFTYPLPADESVRSKIRAEDIAVSYDEQSRTIQLNGLWNNDDAGSDAGASTAASEETRGRKRSRSPKRSRVSDYDEKTGEEIPKPEDGAEDEEEYVEVAKEQPKKTPVTKAIRLPEDANVQGLRAEITDDGFQVWI